MEEGRKNRGKGSLLRLVVTVVIVGALLLAAYFYWQYTQLQNDPESAAREEASLLASKVARHLELPEGEAPTIATVSDQEQLKDQEFFAHAKNGDKILIFTKAKKAVLYRTSADKIIEVAPLQPGDE